MLHYVAQPVINMHLKPDPMSEVDSQALYGTPVQLLEKRNGWTLIQSPDGYSGWTELTKLISRPPQYPSTKTYGQIKSLFAHVYWVDDTSPHPPMITLPFESKLEVVSNDSERWIKVRLLNGNEGWIQRGDITSNPKPLTLAEILTLSHQFIGLPYTWGGTTSFGYDCSGFVQMLYRQMDILLPRNSSMQAQMEKGSPIDLNQLLPGDLLFFGPEGKKVTHVGLYLGENLMIHTKANIRNAAPVVQVNRLDKPLWDEKLMCARRVTSSF